MNSSIAACRLFKWIASPAWIQFANRSNESKATIIFLNWWEQLELIRPSLVNRCRSSNAFIGQRETCLWAWLTRPGSCRFKRINRLFGASNQKRGHRGGEVIWRAFVSIQPRIGVLHEGA